MRTIEHVVLIALVVFQIVVVGPLLMVFWNHTIALEQRTAWICEERARYVELASPGDDQTKTISVKVLPRGCATR